MNAWSRRTTRQRILFRNELCRKIEREVEDVVLNSHGKLVLAGLALMIVVLLSASAAKKDLGLPTCLAALVIAAAVSIKAKSNPLSLARVWGLPGALACASVSGAIIEHFIFTARQIDVGPSATGWMAR